MKKILALVLCAMLLTVLAVPATAKDSASAVTLYGEAAGVEAGPAIDGVIDDVWGQATAYTISNFTDGAEDTGIRATFKVLWKRDTLYILYEVPDTTPNYDHNDAHQRDGVEVKFDLQNIKTEGPYEEEHQFRMTAFRDGSDMAFEAQQSTWDDSAFTIGYADSPTGYVVEMAVSMAKFPLSEGMTLGLDFQINDNAEDSGRTACFQWNDDSNESWQNPSYMGNITLLAVPAPVVVEEAAPAPVEAPAPAPAAVSATPAPRTADPIVIIALGSLISAAGVVIAKKRK